MPDLTDAEVICNYMESRHVDRTKQSDPADGFEWWTLGAYNARWVSRVLDLDALWSVEQRLTGSGTITDSEPDQWRQYLNELSDVIGEEISHRQRPCSRSRRGRRPKRWRA